jgi:hypothetical protein
MLGSVAFSADTPEDAAQAAAESWLTIVDGGDYAGSWEQAARALKGAVKQGDWSGAVGSDRAPLGKVVSRRLKSREHTERPPTTRVIGGRAYTWGQGKYVVIQYETVFASRGSAIETVVPTVDPDGAWRVSSYSVR